MTKKELKDLIKLCKSSGVLSIKANGVELQFTHEAVSPKEVSVQATYEQKISELIESGPINPKTNKPYTDEETLMWSSGGEQ